MSMHGLTAKELHAERASYYLLSVRVDLHPHSPERLTAIKDFEMPKATLLGLGPRELINCFILRSSKSEGRP